MEFRKAVQTDIKTIMNIIKQAQAYFKDQGIDQWQNHYPNRDTIHQDITNGNSYILLQNHQIVATSAISFDEESTYRSIYEGSWITSSDYAVVHRIAVDNNYKGLGLASEILRQVELLCLNKAVHSIRIDTHKQNLSMQKLLHKNHFKYCGIIYLEDGSPRIAFEKVL